MLKIAVVGAQDILGQELVRTLEAHHCSVLPLASGPLTKEQEENDIVAFSPTPELIKDYDAIILAQPEPRGLLDKFSGRVLDVTSDASRGIPAPLKGAWGTENRLFVRPAVEQIPSPTWAKASRTLITNPGQTFGMSRPVWPSSRLPAATTA